MLRERVHFYNLFSIRPERVTELVLAIAKTLLFAIFANILGMVLAVLFLIAVQGAFAPPLGKSYALLLVIIRVRREFCSLPSVFARALALALAAILLLAFQARVCRLLQPAALT